MACRRWILVAGTAGLTLVVGCSSLSDHRWLQRFRNRNDSPPACCGETQMMYDGGMFMGDGGPLLTPGPGVMETPLGAPAPVPNPGAPPNGQRLVPQPQGPTAQPVPFNPNPPR